eukprot:CAMPEP_0173111440 /NCGR_PEP_ID=MMETSP1102-20130122/45181_1 /TAXON_ID=49646 /ORGANISM="Geminigera sp., Strain Caron Lab Isolate" /LENGTH=83 /DNA_ID=CAMNT_0014011835 /DNA_START=340 /DNA_END=588 /DNA_ORIENTATION=-
MKHWTVLLAATHKALPQRKACSAVFARCDKKPQPSIKLMAETTDLEWRARNRPHKIVKREVMAFCMMDCLNQTSRICEISKTW